MPQQAHADTPSDEHSRPPAKIAGADLGRVQTIDDLIPEPDPSLTYSRPKGERTIAGVSWEDFTELTKTRIALMVMITAAIGYAFGLPPEGAAWGLERWIGFIAMIVGTGLSSMGSGALNQAYERDTDGLMPRTQNRPLPAGRMTLPTATIIGAVLTVVGLAVLAIFNGPWAFACCVFTAFSYLLIYTPLKRVTWWSMHVGAIPGAMPPVIGYAAASQGLGHEAWVLFGIMAIWQVPHFLAIAWLYRDDYAKAGLPMLPVIDGEDGKRTFRQTLITSVMLLAIGLLPTLVGMTGWISFGVSLMSGLAFLYLAIRLVQTGTRPAARKLFFASLIYLPLVLAALMLDRT